jgi:hypothetical protein
MLNCFIVGNTEQKTRRNRSEQKLGGCSGICSSEFKIFLKNLVFGVAITLTFITVTPIIRTLT